MNKLSAAVFATLLVSGMVSAQTSNVDATSIPGDTFYQLDRFQESVSVAVASSPVIGNPSQEANVRSRIALERAAEARELADRNRSDDAERVLEQAEIESERAFEAANRSQSETAFNRVQDNFDRQIEVLEEVKSKVPEEAKPGISRAIENTQDRNERVTKAFERMKNRPADRGNRTGKPEDLASPTPPWEKSSDLN